MEMMNKHCDMKAHHRSGKYAFFSFLRWGGYDYFTEDKYYDDDIDDDNIDDDDEVGDEKDLALVICFARPLL